MVKEKLDLEAIILQLLKEHDQLTIRIIAEQAGLSTKLSAARRAIQRALSVLIDKGVIQAEGSARARVYIAKDRSLPVLDVVDVFKNVSLSGASRKLLLYCITPIQNRKSVSYHFDFLRSYQPNQTFYLSPEIQQDLLAVGTVEAIVRPAGTYARHILNRLLVDLSWNSSRLEGNTYSLLETKRLIELGERAAGKDMAEAQMILNHKEAIEYILESIDEVEINLHEICSVHALLSENLLGDSSASGRLRSIAVGISGTTYLPLDNPHMLKEYADLFIQKFNEIQNPFEQSFFALVHLSYLQAFEDVNKRTARLVANMPLIKHNLKPLSFTDVSREEYVLSLLGIYEKNDVSLFRDLYVWAYKKSAERYSAVQQAMGEPNPFKLKYRHIVSEIVRQIVLTPVVGDQVVPTIKAVIEGFKVPESDVDGLFQLIEEELMHLHEGNIARYKIRPSEYQIWENAQR